MDHKFGFTPKDIAIIITGGGLFGAIAQVVFFDKLARMIGEKRLIFFCLVFSSILVFLTTFVQSYFAVLAVTMIIFVGFDLIRPAATSYLSKIAGNEQGFVGGMNSMFTSIGNVFGPVIGGALFDIDVDYPFYFAAFILLFGVGLNYVWIKRTPAFKPYNF